jgi:phospholipase C
MLYRAPADPPSSFIPLGSSAHYGGLDSSVWNPRNASYFNGEPLEKIPIMDSATSLTNPNIDPEETFDHVAQQLYGPAGYADPPRWPMLGFVVDYEYATSGNPVEIMEPFSSEQTAVLSALARNYAISDAWFCSVPSQTWPNRARFRCDRVKAVRYTAAITAIIRMLISSEPR